MATEIIKEPINTKVTIRFLDQNRKRSENITVSKEWTSKEKDMEIKIDEIRKMVAEFLRSKGFNIVERWGRRW